MVFLTHTPITKAEIMLKVSSHFPMLVNMTDQLANNRLKSVEMKPGISEGSTTRWEGLALETVHTTKQARLPALVSTFDIRRWFQAMGQHKDETGLRCRVGDMLARNSYLAASRIWNYSCVGMHDL